MQTPDVFPKFPTRLAAILVASGLAVGAALAPTGANAFGGGAATCGLLADGSVGCGAGVVVPMPNLSDGDISQADLAQAAILAMSLAMGPGAAAPAPAPEPPGPLVSTTADGQIYVTQPAFDDFIAMHPTPAEFQARYPQIDLVLPGDLTTMELRTDNSRYIADVSVEGRIYDGDFR
jgi:hypothetical protein